MQSLPVLIDCLIFEMLFRKTLLASNFLRDSVCEYLIALSSQIFAFYHACLLGILFTYIVLPISFILDLIMTLSERRNVVAFETFNQDGFKLFNFIAMFYS